MRAAGLLSKGEIEEIFTRYEQVCGAYPRLDSDMVSCHSDLKAENILFDGQRVWVVGWHAALLNDRYFDLAVAPNFVVTNDADEWTYLEQYFGQRPDEYQRARFFLMRQVMHMFSATVFLLLGSAGKAISQSENRPSFRDLGSSGKFVGEWQPRWVMAFPVEYSAAHIRAVRPLTDTPTPPIYFKDGRIRQYHAL
jgi:thiamine kinase-like enzyme